MPAGSRIRASIDAVHTKLAIDFQTIRGDSFDAVMSRCLGNLREAVGVDAAFVAFVSGDGKRITRVHSDRAVFATFNPEVLTGESLEECRWLRGRLDQQRLVDVTNFASGEMLALPEGRRLHALKFGSLLAAGFATQGRLRGMLALAGGQPRSAWDVDVGLLLKLLATSLASGLERLDLERELHEVKERDELAMFGANDGVWDFDMRSNSLYLSPRWKAMLGYGPDDLSDSAPDWRRLVHPDDLARVQGQIREHLEGKTEIFESVHRMRHCNGEWRWVLSRAKAREDATGRTRRLVGVELDITDRKLYEEALFREKESAQITLQSIGDGVITTDAEGYVEYVNPVAEELTGWRLDDANGRHIDEIFRSFHEETCEPLDNPMSMAIRRTRAIKSVRPTLLIRRDGNELYIENTASPIRDGRGKVTGGVLVFHDVSEARELNRRLSYHASHDILTGLVNRREFESRLERALKSAKARETSYALLYLDLDQFKIINDTCGHSAGDALLGQLGALLKSKIRWRDTLARLGGDEFGVLLESCTVDEAMTSAEGLRETIREFKFNWDERIFRLGVSIGVVPITVDNDDVASLLSAADGACAAAKEAGRNRIHCFAENDIELMRRRREMQWAARINNALDEARFELFRQTILPLAGQHRARRALRTAAEDARRERQRGFARVVHCGGRTLWHHTEH